MIYVTPLSRLDETLRRSRATHLVTLLRDDSIFVRPDAFSADQHLMLRMHDIAEKRPGMVAPSRRHVADLLRFAQAWDRSTPLAINCFAGISRSTAAAYIVAAALAPGRDEAELAQELRRVSPTATPNPRLVALADRMLERRGRMVGAIAAIGRGADAFEGEPFVLDIGSSATG